MNRLAASMVHGLTAHICERRAQAEGGRDGAGARSGGRSRAVISADGTCDRRAVIGTASSEEKAQLAREAGAMR